MCIAFPIEFLIKGNMNRFSITEILHERRSLFHQNKGKVSCFPRFYSIYTFFFHIQIFQAHFLDKLDSNQLNSITTRLKMRERVKLFLITYSFFMIRELNLLRLSSRQAQNMFKSSQSVFSATNTFDISLFDLIFYQLQFEDMFQRLPV